MKFEEALNALREGKKIRHPTFDEDEYLSACRVGFLFDDTPLNERPISILKIKNGIKHDEMFGVLNYVKKIRTQLKKILTEEDFKKYNNFYTNLSISEIFDQDIFKYPQLNLILVMSDEWEIVIP